MESSETMNHPGKFSPVYRRAFAMMVLTAIAGVAFAVGIAWANQARADDTDTSKKTAPRVVYPKKTELDFEGLQIEGEVRNPGEFYFQHRPEEKFDSLVKRRMNFHEQMLRDAVMSR